MIALSTRGLAAGYGKVAVVRDFDLELGRGEVLALLGPNGAGKTTLLLTLSGLLPRMGGEMALLDDPVPSSDPTAMNRRGLVLVPDDRALFTGLTTRENLKLGSSRSSVSVDEVLDLFPALRARLDIRAGSLSGGEQQMLAMARGLAQGPKVLLIDELSMGLAPIIVQQLLPTVRKAADATGAAVILVEQHVQMALSIADQAIVIVHGETVLRASGQELLSDLSQLENAYLGVSGAVADA